MATTIDSSIKSVLGASGLSIDKIVQGSTGAVLWNRATPYTITAFQNYTWTWSSGYGAASEHEVRSNELYMLLERTGGGSVSQGFSAILPTQGCNRIRVKCSTVNTYGSGANASICGVLIHEEIRDQYVYLTIPDGTESINFTAYLNCYELELEAELYVKEIYFYYE